MATVTTQSGTRTQTTQKPLTAPSTDWRRSLHIPQNLGQELADGVANGMGSWNFIIIQSAIVAGWIALNLVGFFSHWDPYPFILLNLLFSTQAAYAAPIIMMSQNRQAQKDHIRDDHEAEEVDLLYQINQSQLEILTLLRTNLCPEDAEKVAAALTSANSALTQKPANGATKPMGAASGAKPRPNNAGQAAQPVASKVAGATPRRRR